MNNTQKRYMKIPWTINILGKKTIRVLKRWEKKFNTKKFIQIIGLCILAVILLLMINKTEATEDIKPKEDTVQAIEVKEPLEVKEIANIDDVPERAFKLITKYEGFHDKPYWDYKQWSCGYGMRCSKDTKNITKEKSKQFVMERIDLIRTKHKLHNIDDSIEVALISFTYNIWHPPVGYKWYIQHWYINGLKNRFKEYSYAGWKFMRGLHKRRVDESSFKN